MGVAARVVTWPPGSGGSGIAIDEHRWTMFEIPEPGSRYWHGRDAYGVLDVEATDPPTVHLEHDAEWERVLQADLPRGYWFDGGRSSTSGEWHFTVVKDGQDRPVGLFHGDLLEEALGSAMVAARRHAEAA